MLAAWFSIARASPACKFLPCLPPPLPLLTLGRRPHPLTPLSRWCSMAWAKAPPLWTVPGSFIWATMRPGPRPHSTTLTGSSFSANKTWGSQDHANYTGFAWYRRHIDITTAPGAAPDLALYFAAHRGCVRDLLEWNAGRQVRQTASPRRLVLRVAAANLWPGRGAPGRARISGMESSARFFRFGRPGRFCPGTGHREPGSDRCPQSRFRLPVAAPQAIYLWTRFALRVGCSARSARLAARPQPMAAVLDGRLLAGTAPGHATARIAHSLVLQLRHRHGAAVLWNYRHFPVVRSHLAS